MARHTVKGWQNWQIIALSEGWANYREWVMCRDRLGYDSFSRKAYEWNLGKRPRDYKLGFPVFYSTMFDELQLNGYSFSNMESALASYSFAEYRDNLINKQPYLSSFITEIVNRYESHNF